MFRKTVQNQGKKRGSIHPGYWILYNIAGGKMKAAVNFFSFSFNSKICQWYIKNDKNYFILDPFLTEWIRMVSI
jgi:hypothetical protein